MMDAATAQEQVMALAQAAEEAAIEQGLQVPQISAEGHPLLAPAPLPPASMTFEDATKSWDMLQFHKKARDHEKYCDLILHVHGRVFPCHRLILAANSPYFDSIFQSRIANSAGLTGNPSRNSQYYTRNGVNNVTKTVVMESLIVGCTEPEVFQIFLNFMYTGNVTIDKGNVAELLRLGNNFMVGRLKEYCAEFLERFIDAENCIQVKEVGEKYGISRLTKVATQFVQNNLGDVINHEIMMELLPKQVENFVMDKGYQISHDIAVKFMSRWVCHDIPNRERDYKHMLTNIDWSTMEHEGIVSYIDQEPLYGSSERCFYYILQSLGDKGIRVDKYEDIFQALQQKFGQEVDQPLGYGDNLLQMAFNSAMEGLQVPPESSWSDGKEKEDVEMKPNISKPKKLSLEQRRRLRLRRQQRNRALKRWVVVRLDRPKTKCLAANEITADSSGDEECDPSHSTNGYQCHMCPFSAKKVSKLERHLACIHAHDVTYRCSECGYTCKWNRDYFLHMKTHFDGPPYRCSNCEFSSPKIGTLISHKITHLDLKPYHCLECEFKSRSKANLAVHMKMHNNEKPYRCGICGRNFASKNSLDQHAVGHNTDKTYSCTQCPFSTKYLNHFTNHKKTHHVQTGKKGKELYRCSDSQCKYTTSKKSQLESHMRSHAGVRPHVCSICGRRFLEKSHLVRHERIHFNERPFKCEECDYASTRRDKLKEHKTRHHGANASAKSPYKPRPHKAKANGSQSSGDSNQGSQSNSVVYAKKSTASNSQASQQPSTASQLHAQQQHEGSNNIPTTGNELEFIIPHSGAIGLPDGSAATFAQMTSSSGLDLQQMANAGIVQLRPYQPQVASVSTVSLPTSISNAAIVSSATSLSSVTHNSMESTPPPVLNSSLMGSSSSGAQLVSLKPCTSSERGQQKVTKSRLILVQQGKPSETIQVAQTLASFPGAISAQDLQRTLGIKLEDLQAQGLIGIQTTGPSGTRTIKLEELTGVHGVTQAVSQGGNRVQGGTTTTMVLDAAQLQLQSGFDRGIPITIASVQVPSNTVQQVPSSQSGHGQTSSNNPSSIPPNPGQTQGTNQQPGNQSSNGSDFSAGLNNLFC